MCLVDALHERAAMAGHGELTGEGKEGEGGRERGQGRHSWLAWREGTRGSASKRAALGPLLGSLCFMSSVDKRCLLCVRELLEEENKEEEREKDKKRKGKRKEEKKWENFPNLKISTEKNER
jgi:hypothetical protein